jgi:DNA-binding PadR family transcriptional regulator
VKSIVQAAVLSLIIEDPSYGAVVGRRFTDRYAGLLDSGHQHIYAAVGRLHEAGMIEPIRAGEPEWAPHENAKKIEFRATASGARAYRDWLHRPIEDLRPLSRQEMLVRLASTRASDRRTALLLLDRYERTVLELARQTPLAAGNVMDELLADERQGFVQAEIHWIRRSRSRLREDPSSNENRARA